MGLHLNAWKWIDFCTIFISVWIILSTWAGYAGILSPVWAIVSLVIAFFINQKIKLSQHQPPVRISLCVIAVIALGMGILFFGVQGGYDLSADATPSVATQLIGLHIPLTYLPYFDIPFLYQLGLPVLASQLASLGVSPHTALWFFAISGIGFFLLGLIRFGKMINPNPAFLFWIPIVFLGTRLPLHNVFLGEYPWMLSMGLGMMAVLLFERSWKLGALVLTASGIAHPYIGGLFAIIWICFHHPPIKDLLKVGIASIALSAPIFFFQTIPFLGMPKAPFVGADLFSFESILAYMFLVGAVPCILTGAWVVHKKMTRQAFTPRELLLLFFVVGGLILSVFLSTFFPNAILGGKLLILPLFGSVLLGAHFLSTVITSSRVPLAVGSILLISATLLVTSSSMQSYAMGSKATLEEAHFSTFLHAWDEKVVPVLFLSHGHGKMAQYSEKIPMDPQGAHFTLSLHVLRTDEAVHLREKSAAFNAMLKAGNADHIMAFLEKYPATYVVVNTRTFPALELNVLAEKDGFILYQGNSPLSNSSETP